MNESRSPAGWEPGSVKNLIESQEIPFEDDQVAADQQRASVQQGLAVVEVSEELAEEFEAWDRAGANALEMFERLAQDELI